MVKKVILSVVLLIVTVVGLGGLYAMMIGKLIAAGENQQMPPTAVSTAIVDTANWEESLSAIGSVVAFQGVTVVSEGEGVVREILFEAGKQVESGQVLLKLDIDVEMAQLRAAEAQLELARTNAKRARELFESRTISRAEFDSADASLKSAVAEVESLQAVVDKKTVRAPFSGRLGIRRVNLGQYMRKGDPVVSLQALDPVFVEFLTPQQNLSTLGEGMTVRVQSNAFPEEVFEGKISAINPQIDEVSRNLRVQATVPNGDDRLRPGMFVDIEVVLPGKREVLVIPQTAVLFAPYGNSVFVVEQGEAGPDGSKGLTVTQEFVRTGEKRGDFVTVTSGLEAGQRVVSTGAFKLQPGMGVVESDVAVPTPELDPKPENS